MGRPWSNLVGYNENLNAKQSFIKPCSTRNVIISTLATPCISSKYLYVKSNTLSKLLFFHWGRTEWEGFTNNVLVDLYNLSGIVVIYYGRIIFYTSFLGYRLMRLCLAANNFLLLLFSTALTISIGYGTWVQTIRSWKRTRNRR